MTDGIDIVRHDKWLARRRQGVGASDVARVLTRQVGEMTLWAVKTGKQEEEFPWLLGEFGHAVELVILKAINRQYDDNYYHAGRRIDGVVDHFHLDGPGAMFATPDFLRTTGREHPPFAEGKTCDRVAAWKWAGGPDLYPLIQVNATMMCSDALAEPWMTALIAVLIGNGYNPERDFRTFEVERDDDLCGEIHEWVETFWRHVERDIPPPPDGLDSTLETIRLLYPIERERKRQGVLPAKYLRDYRAWKRKQRTVERLEREIAAHKQEIEFAMGKAGVEDATIAVSDESPNPPRFQRLSYERKGYEVKPTTVNSFREIK